MRPADYVAVMTTDAKVVEGPNGGDGLATCPLCQGVISTGTIIHKLIPRRGGSHVYVHQECWP